MDHRQTMRHKNLLFTALGDLIRRPVRSIVVTLCLATILFPLVTALAISQGLRFQAEISIKEGADFYVSKDLFGGEGPISLSYLKEVSGLEGISRATVRVVGRTYFVDRLVAVVGLDREGLLALKPIVKGDVPKARGEVVVGPGIADEFGIKPGPGMRFTVAQNNRKVFTPTGTLHLSSLWSSYVIIMHYEDANEFFRLKGVVTQLLLYKSSPSSPPLKNSITEQMNKRGAPGSSLLIGTRDHIQEILLKGYSHKGGIYTVLFVIGAALAIPAFLVTSGFGLRELDREIGLLKAMGWRTSEILEKVFLENLLISLAAVSISIILSMAWAKGLNGILIGQFFVAEIGVIPEVEIPSRYLPSHGLFCLAFALGVTLLGGLLTAWHKANIPPSELMR
ncbi:MAG: FtsX-like permease family protein [Deltaproteobacteria bacterium]|nr:FtsX-like permease family protein [Deltaproteobacteria bacterium]